MRLIPFSQVTPPHSVVEVGGVLVTVVAASVKVVELEAEAPLLSCIDCEKSLEMVFSVGPVACRIISKDGNRRQCGSELEVGRLYDEHIIQIEKKEL